MVRVARPRSSSRRLTSSAREALEKEPAWIQYSVTRTAFGAALGVAIPWLVIVVYKAIRGVEGMGLGDVKLLAMIGAFLGWRGVLLTLLLGAGAGAAVGLTLIATGRGRRDTELPFGTFLAAAALVALFWGEGFMLLLGWRLP